MSIFGVLSPSSRKMKHEIDKVVCDSIGLSVWGSAGHQNISLTPSLYGVNRFPLAGG